MANFNGVNAVNVTIFEILRSYPMRKTHNIFIFSNQFIPHMIDILKLPTAKIRNKCLSEFQFNIKSEMQEWQFHVTFESVFFLLFCCSTRRTSDLSLIVYALWKLHAIGVCTSPLPPLKINALRFAKENSKWTLCSVCSPIRRGGGEIQRVQQSPWNIWHCSVYRSLRRLMAGQRPQCLSEYM